MMHLRVIEERKRISLMRPSSPVIFHYATGGFVHFLTLLGRTLSVVNRFGAIVVAFTEYHRPLGEMQIDEIFTLSHPVYARVPSRVWKHNFRKALPNPQDLRPHRWLSDNPKHRRVAYVKTVEEDFFLSAYLPRRGFEIAHTTGDDVPNFPALAREACWEIILSAVKLNPEVSSAISEKLITLPQHYLGVHFRNSDHKTSIEATLHTLEQMIGESGISDVLWATDDVASARIAEDRFPNVRFYCFQLFELGSMKNLHYGYSGEEAKEQLTLALVDIVGLFRSAIFLPSDSGTSWTRFINFLRQKPHLAENFFGLPES